MNKIIEELKNDANFMGLHMPYAVNKYAHDNAESRSQFVAYYQRFRGELLKRVFAYRWKKGCELEVTEVIRKLANAESFAVRNLYYTSMGGYSAVYKRNTINSRSYSYYGYGHTLFDGNDYDRWFTEYKAWNPTAHDLNPEVVFDIEKYKYCGYPGKGDLLNWCEKYSKNNGFEYLGKLGIYNPSTLLLNEVKKNHQLIGFLRANAREVNLYGPKATIYAFKNNIGIEEAQEHLYELASHNREMLAYVPSVKGTKIDREKLYQWIEGQNIELTCYNDYLEAVRYLGLDLNDTKNVYPREFMRMHDLRINEMNSRKAIEKAENLAKLDARIKEAAERVAYMNYQAAGFTVIVASSRSEFVREGEELHHCVGKMGYDLKMANGESVIVFVRKTAEVDTPLVTIEWDLKNKKVKQCYADHDSRPAPEILDFVSEWEKRTKTLQIEKEVA